MNSAPEGARAHFERHGWACLPGLFSRTEAGAMARFVEALVALPEQAGSVWKYGDDEARARGERVLSRIEHFRDQHGGLRLVLEDPRLLGLLAQWLAEPVLLFKDKINLKLPGSGGFALHQDAQAGWEVYAPLHVTAMVSIDATTHENGCLEIARGPRLSALRGEIFRPLNAVDVAEFAFESLLTEPGDVVIFDSFVPHRSAPNRTSSARRVLYATYNAASHGDHYARYFADKHANYPPDVERLLGRAYQYRV
jgi:hypothetical protein